MLEERYEEKQFNKKGKADDCGAVDSGNGTYRRSAGKFYFAGGDSAAEYGT